VAARAGGADPDANPGLRLAWDKATAANMPKDNILRAIQRGAGGADDANYEEIRYEGYGIGGAALIIDCMTDNRQRTVSEVRHTLSKHGGNLGQDGSVVFMFKHCGQFIFAPGTSEEAVMEVGLENGADDVQTDEEGVIEVTCEPTDYTTLKQAFDAAGLTAEIHGVIMKAESKVQLAGDDAERMQKIIDLLEDLDDVQEVYTTAVMDDE
ncbi:MAG: YebC/PmpR family DNA-binding transcriptional regulator, partial [Castellaniella sp.]